MSIGLLSLGLVNRGAPMWLEGLNFLSYLWPPRKGACEHPKLLQSCLTLCNPMDCRPLGSSSHRLLQARILEWVAMPSSGSSQPRDRTRISYVSCVGRNSLPLAPPGKPLRWNCIPLKMLCLFSDIYLWNITHLGESVLSLVFLGYKDYAGTSITMKTSP